MVAAAIGGSSMKALYTAHATSTGGRDGQGKTLDGALDLKLTPPKETGGSGNGVNPEQLFAVGYAACYLGALKHVAAKQKTPLTDGASVTSHVTLGARNDKKGFGLAVKLDVSLPDVPKAKAAALVKKAHVVCPYSHAIRKNVRVITKIV
jgi:Ohr subfamily peroxiredoxin